MNLLEEEGNCNKCHYCNFLNKLADALKEKLFFTDNAHINIWDVKFENDIIKVEAVG